MIAFLPDATWAILFLIGFYLKSIWGFVLITIIAIAIDFTQIAARGGHQDFFLAPSYLFIIPAYFVLWLAGRYLSNHYSENFKGLLFFCLSVFISVVFCHLIASGGYYWMSLNVIELSTKEFISRTFDYLPLALKITFSYLSFTAIIHLIFTRIFSSHKQPLI